MPLDADDIARLYGTHARALVACFARRTFDAQVATELMAETFASAVADRRRFRGDDALDPARIPGTVPGVRLGYERDAGALRRLRQGGTLTGARVLAADRSTDVRSIVYGVAGDGLRAVTLITASGDRSLKIGPNGTFVGALRGYPEDQAAAVTLRFAVGRTEHHSFGAGRDTIPDPEGGQAWTVERYTLGTRFQCTHVRPARRGGAGQVVTSTGESAQVVTPTACLALRTSTRAWVADARRLHPGDQGVSGFDRWGWQDHPARTVVWGVARDGKTLRAVTLLGAGAPSKLALSKQGGFAAVLPVTVDPAKLSLDVVLADGTVEHGKPREGLAPDLVKSRRPR